jgi:putative peptidoglycan lipid II flippase
MQLPLGIFAQALSVAIFPTLAALAARREIVGVRAQTAAGLRNILFLTVPSSAGIAILAVPIVRLMYQRGHFTWHDTQMTASAAQWMALAIFAYSGGQIVNRAFYALHDTLRPMAISTGCTVLYVALCFAFRGPMRHNGLALAMSLAAAANLIALVIALARKVGGLPIKELAASLGRTALATAALVTWLFGVREGAAAMLPPTAGGGPTALACAVVALLGVAGGATIYFGVARLLRAPEVDFVLAALRRQPTRSA